MAGLPRHLALVSGLAGIVLVGWWIDPLFLTIANQRDVLGQVAINGILAVGMTLVILSGGIDLSVGSVMSLCTVVCAMLIMPAPSAEDRLALPGWLTGAVGQQGFTRAHAVVLPAAAVFAALAGAALASRAFRRAAPARRRTAVGLTVLGFAAGAGAAGALALLRDGATTVAVVLLVPPVGAMMGLINGFVVARARLQPFIVTLAMMITAVGLARYVAGQGGKVHAIYTGTPEQPGAPESFARLGASVLTVGRETLRAGRKVDVKLLPVPGLFFAGAWLAALFVLHKLPIGRYVYAVGGNEEAARLSGIPVERVKLFVYAVSGGLAGLAAVLYAAQYRQGLATAGQMKELDAIAAVVIGGTSLAGGRGGLLGTLVGVMIFGYLSNILQLRAVSSEIQEILKGVIIVAAAVMQSGNLFAAARTLRRSGAAN